MRFMRGLMRAHQPRLSPVKRFHPSSVLPTLLPALRALGGQRVSQLVAYAQIVVARRIWPPLSGRVATRFGK